MSKTITIGSSTMFNSPGLWAWFKVARRSESKAWCREFVRSFTNNRIPAEDIETIIAGKATDTVDGDKLVLTIPEASDTAQPSQPANPFTMVWRSKDDGYVFLHANGRLYFADHSADGRDNTPPRSPEECHDPISPLKDGSVICVNGRWSATREDGFTVLLSAKAARAIMHLELQHNTN